MRSESDIIWLESVDSTNLELRRRIRTLANLAVIAAKSQTEGRGQGDHTWHSRPGENLTASILLRFSDIAPLPAAESLFITRIITLSLTDLLSELGIEARIKWPNDIWVGPCKICGLLIENILRGNEVAESIVGIGLNVNETAFPADLPNPVSIASLLGHSLDVSEIALRLRDRIKLRAGMYPDAEGKRKLTEDFDALVFRLPEEA